MHVAARSSKHAHTWQHDTRQGPPGAARRDVFVPFLRPAAGDARAELRRAVNYRIESPLTLWPPVRTPSSNRQARPHTATAFQRLELTLWVKPLDDVDAEYTALHGVSSTALVDDVKGSVLCVLNLPHDKAHVSLRRVVRDGAASAGGDATGTDPTAAEEARAVPLRPPQTLADAGVVSGDCLVVAHVQRGARMPHCAAAPVARCPSVSLTQRRGARAPGLRAARAHDAAQARHLACGIPSCLGMHSCTRGACGHARAQRASHAAGRLL
jgi:hypothetical protein